MSAPCTHFRLPSLLALLVTCALSSATTHHRVVVDTSSKSKYGSVIMQRGGWEWFQSLLSALDSIAKKHNTTISNVASRWVLDKPAVGGVILGARNATHVQVRRM